MFILETTRGSHIMSTKRKHADTIKPLESAEDAFHAYVSGGSSTPAVDAVANLFIELKKTEGVPMEASARSRVTLTLPTFSSEHLYELLQESRDVLAKNGLHVRIPPCIEGPLCLGLDARIPGVRHGVAQPLGIWMTPMEYANVLDHGMMPKEKRQCALCAAHTTSFKYLRWRLAATPAHASNVTSVVADDMQPFCVRVDEPGGFNSRHCIPFRRDTTLSIIAPMVLPQLFLLENKYTSNGTRYVCQRRMTHEYATDALQYF